MNPFYPVNPAHAVRRADRSAPNFARADFVHTHTRQGLLDRLEPMSIDATVVVDLGCGTGTNLAALGKRFRGSKVLGVERSPAMLARARRGMGWRSRCALLCADPAALPLPDHSVDVLFSNLTLAGRDDPGAVAAEAARVLRKDGLFAFATLGPDSLDTLRRAWAAVDDEPHVQRFPDMHDLGDLLVHAGLSDPVVDVDRLEIEFADPAALFRDLTAMGARNALAVRRRSLTGRGRFERMQTELARAGGDGPIRVGLELVYGHCWGTGRPRRDGFVRIPADTIPLRRR